jgi:esterase
MSLRPAEELEHLKLATELAGIAVPEIVLPERRHVVVGGMRLHYLDWGTSGQPFTLFLHGGALNAHTWDVVALALRTEYHCVALDQRGHGDSEWSPGMEYEPEAHLRDIEGLVEHLGVERFRLVGQSMGALNAFVYATRHAENLAGLVLIDAGPNVRSGGAQRIGEFVTETAEIDSIDAAIGKALAFNPLRDPRLLRRSLLYAYRQLPSGRWTRKIDMRHWGREDFRSRAAQAAARWQHAAQVTCPTLVVRGAESDVFLDEDAESFARTLPDARWVKIAGAGHTVQGDNPRGLCEALRPFFTEHSM